MKLHTIIIVSFFVSCLSYVSSMRMSVMKSSTRFDIEKPKEIKCDLAIYNPGKPKNGIDCSTFNNENPPQRVCIGKVGDTEKITFDFNTGLARLKGGCLACAGGLKVLDCNNQYVTKFKVNGLGLMVVNMVDGQNDFKIVWEDTGVKVSCGGTPEDSFNGWRTNWRCVADASDVLDTGYPCTIVNNELSVNCDQLPCVGQLTHSNPITIKNNKLMRGEECVTCVGTALTVFPCTNSMNVNIQNNGLIQLVSQYNGPFYISWTNPDQPVTCTQNFEEWRSMWHCREMYNDLSVKDYIKRQFRSLHKLFRTLPDNFSFLGKLLDYRTVGKTYFSSQNIDLDGYIPPLFYKVFDKFYALVHDSIIEYETLEFNLMIVDFLHRSILEIFPSTPMTMGSTCTTEDEITMRRTLMSLKTIKNTLKGMFEILISALKYLAGTTDIIINSVTIGIVSGPVASQISSLETIKKITDWFVDYIWGRYDKRFFENCKKPSLINP